MQNLSAVSKNNYNSKQREWASAHSFVVFILIKNMLKSLQKLILVLPLMLLQPLQAQTLEMEFPAFAGSTYEFIIFQGDQSVKAVQGTIPPNGKFSLTIPSQYAPYTGMGRWLITNSETGGGLDLAIPGKGFKVSCLSPYPNEENIIYEGYDPVNELNRIYNAQQLIINRFEALSNISQLYDSTHPLYDGISQEIKLQQEAYETFHQDLKKNTNHNARFLPILNMVSGITPKLTQDMGEKADLVNDYMVHQMNFDHLYTSGHWTGIIHNWVELQTRMYGDPVRFAKDFASISQRISNPIQYTDFTGKVTFYLTKNSQDNFIEEIAPIVKSSGKITEYLGSMSVYKTALKGMPAPDLTITDLMGTPQEPKTTTTILKSSAFATHGFEKTLVVFYESGCGPCEALLQQLPGQYELLKQKKIDIIAIAADQGILQFQNTSRSFPWSRTYCDFMGKAGINFQNYGVVGTPTMFLVDTNGTIEKRVVDVNELIRN
jgi:thiol-disulfide isomerase/thioredoxin